ncbi:MAG: response regulator [Bacteroidota bacterium]|jgi:response regulator of citrate/malate metabolism
MSKKVLIVEDEQLVAHLVETYVESSGCCKVIGAVDNGEEAMELVKKEKPDYILMDVRIEGNKDGIETALDINKLFDVPIIYTSGNSDEKTIDRAKQTNMLAFLVKPLRKDDLISILCPK